MRGSIEEDEYSHSEWSKEQNEESLDIPLDNVEGAASYVNEELRMRISTRISAPNDSLYDMMQVQNHDAIFSIFDNLALPVGSDDGAESGNDDSNRDTDMPFDLGPPGVGTPAMSFREFMDLDIPDAYSEEHFQLGMPRVGEPSKDIDEL